MSRQPPLVRPGRQSALDFLLPASIAGASPELMAALQQLVSAANRALLASGRDASKRADDVSALGQRDASAKIYTESTTARAGQFLRVSPPDSRGVALLLPSPENTRPGDKVTVSLEAPLGDLRVSCVPNQGAGARVALGTVNGQTRATFTTAGLITFTSNGATHWTTQAEHPAESATITLESIRATVTEQAGSIGWGTVLGVDRRSRNHSPLIDRGQFIGFGDVSGLPSSGQLRSAANFEAAVSGSFALNATEVIDLNSTADVVNVSGSTGINLATAAGDITIDASGVFELDCTDAHIHPTGALHLGHEGFTASIHQGCVGAWEGVAGDFSLQSSADAAFSSANSHKISTGAVLRLEIDSTGGWNLAGDPGSFGQFMRSSGAGTPPTWHTFALTDLPSQAADTFLGNVGTIASTPVAVNLSTLAGTGLAFGSHAFSVDASALAGAGLSSFGSVLFVGAGDGITVAADTVAVDATAIAGAGLEDDGSNNLRIAAAAAGNGLTGGAGSALAVGGSTSIIVGANDVQRAALTNEVTASQNSNSCTVTRSTNFQSSPWTGQHQHNANVYYSGSFIGLDTKATVDAMSSGDIRKGGSMAIASNATIALQAGTGVIVAGSGGGSAQGWLRINEGVSPPLGGLASYEGMYWARGSSSIENMPMYTDSSNADHEIAYILDDDDKSARTMARCIFWDDFLTGFGVTAPTAGNTYFYSDTTWLVEATGSAGSVASHDDGASGDSTAVGSVDLTTAASSGASVRMYKGAATSSRWIRASNVKSFKCRCLISSASSSAFAIGLTDAPYGGGDAAYFYFDTAIDTTIHAFSANTAGATSNDTDTNIAPGTSYREYEIREGASALLWEFLIDGTVVATHTMTSKSRGLNLVLLVFARSASARTLRVDHVSLEGKATR